MSRSKDFPDETNWQLIDDAQDLRIELKKLKLSQTELIAMVSFLEDGYRQRCNYCNANEQHCTQLDNKYSIPCLAREARILVKKWT